MRSGKNAIISLILVILLAFLPVFSLRSALAEEEPEGPEEIPIDLESEEEILSVGDEDPGADGLSIGLNVDDVPPEEPDSVSLDTAGESLNIGEGEEPIEIIAPVQPGDEVLGQDDGEVLGAAAYGLTTSMSSLFIRVGDRSSFTVTAWASEACTLSATYNNTAINLAWGNSFGNDFYLKYTTNGVGSGVITVKLIRDRDCATLVTRYVSYQVVPNEPTALSVSASNVSLEYGKSMDLTVTISGLYFNADLTRSGDNIAALGIRADNACCIGTGRYAVTYHMTGSYVASGEVMLRLTLEDGSLVAWKTFKFSVYKKETPSIAVSPGSVTVDSGKSATVRVSLSGFSGDVTLEASPSNGNFMNVGLRQDSPGSPSITMTITGTSQGSGKVFLYMWSQATGALLALAYVDVTVNAVHRPTLNLSLSTLHMAKKTTVSVTASYNHTKNGMVISWETLRDNVTCSWSDSGPGYHELSITAKDEGEDYITVRILDGTTREEYVSRVIHVYISGKTISDVAYPFENYTVGGNGIDLRLIQVMFGDTEYARTLYTAGQGTGGVCFGMAGTAAMLNVATESPTVDSFKRGKTVLSKLGKNDRNNTFNLTVDEFIQVMYVAQESDAMSLRTGLGNFLSVVKSETDAGRPVMICIRGESRGKDAGHAVMAFGYREREDGGCDIRIYDSNYQKSIFNMNETTLEVRKSGSSYYWSYSPLNWGSGKKFNKFSYLRYSDILSLWNNRRQTRFPGYNLLATSENSFSLYDIDGECVLEFANGALIAGDDVTLLEDYGVLPGGSPASGSRLFLVPQGYYTVVDGTPGSPIDIMMADELLSARVITDADEFDMIANDASDIASVNMLAGVGESYDIILGSSRPGDADQTRLEGVGTGKSISLGLVGGELSMMGTLEASLTMSDDVLTCRVIAEAGPGGTVAPSGENTVPLGEDALFSITPDENCRIKDVWVDGVSVGAVQDYLFEDVGQSHTIYAEFARDINTCTIRLSQSLYAFDGTEHMPSVTVTDPSGYVLVEGLDYVVGYADNEDVGTGCVYVSGVQGGNYYSTALETFGIELTDTGVLSTGYDAAANKVHVALSCTGDVRLAVAAYGTQGEMLHVELIDVAMGTTELDVAMASSARSARTIKVFLLDDAMRPIGPVHRAK